jgi:hypothetical protein
MYTVLEVTNESTYRRYTLYFSKETFGDSVNHIVEYIFSFIILFFLTNTELIISRPTKSLVEFYRNALLNRTPYIFFEDCIKIEA